MNNRLRTGIIIFIISVIILAVLMLYFNYNRWYLLVIISLGIIGGLSTALFNAFANPYKLIYKYMFIIKGIAFGLLMGVGMYMGVYLDSQIFHINEFLKSEIVAIPIGIITTGGMSYISNRQLIRKAKLVSPKQFMLIDTARIITSDTSGQPGVLVLEQNDLVFHFESNKGESIHYKLKDLKVSLSYSKYLKIPKGILINDRDEVLVAFPKYWFHFIAQPHNLKVLD